MARFTKSAAIVLCAAVLISNAQEDFAENSIKVSKFPSNLISFSFFAYINIQKCRIYASQIKRGMKEINLFAITNNSI